MESAWSYRYPPALKAALKKRQQGQDPDAQSIAWKAQDRLHRKYMKLLFKGKPSPIDLYLGMCDIGHLPPNAEGSEALALDPGSKTEHQDPKQG